MENLVSRFAKIFKLPEADTKSLIISSLASTDPENELLQILGYDNIDDIIYLIANKADILDSQALLIDDNAEDPDPHSDKENVILHDFYEEHILPVKQPIKAANLVPVNRLYPDDRAYFKYEMFNPVQSAVFETAYNSDKNMLVSAPTGCGKTDVALLCILRALRTGLKNSKIVYIAPMKALASEITLKYKNVFKYNGNVNVCEYTGDTTDRDDNKKLINSNLIISTPEKFDVCTRKLDNLINENICLLILDEIHILHDNRGSVIEALVCRIFRYVEIYQKNIRIVGLSATLPNYKDIGTFIHANSECIFNFSAKYRPVPLQVSVIGTGKIKKAEEIIDFERNVEMNLNELFICKKKNPDNANSKNNREHSNTLLCTHEQTQINNAPCKKNLEHSNTSLTKCEHMYTDDVALKESLEHSNSRSITHEKFYPDNVACRKGIEYTNPLLPTLKCTSHHEDISKYILVQKVNELLNENHQILIFVTSRRQTQKLSIFLKNLFPEKSFDIHHAGLSKEKRHLAEYNFSIKKTDVLCTTSTLAWGVNLPARAVIVKGTTYYSPDDGKFMDLSILDILQIFGRAGRPQYDNQGQAILITSGESLQKYLNLLKNNKFIESNLLHNVVDLLNSEIYLNNIFDVSSALTWLKSTFMFVRMMKVPMHYGFSSDEVKKGQVDKVLVEYIELSINRLIDSKMITKIQFKGRDLVNVKYRDTNKIQADKSDKIYEYAYFEATATGRIASLYYISHETIQLWNDNLSYVYDEDSVLSLLFAGKEFGGVMLKEDELHDLKIFCMDHGLEYDSTVLCKLKTIYYLHKKGIPVTHSHLQCDSYFVLKNLERHIGALQEITLLYKMYNTYLICENMSKYLTSDKWVTDERKLAEKQISCEKNLPNIKQAAKKSVKNLPENNIKDGKNNSTKICTANERNMEVTCSGLDIHVTCLIKYIYIEIVNKSPIKLKIYQGKDIISIIKRSKNFVKFDSTYLSKLRLVYDGHEMPYKLKSNYEFLLYKFCMHICSDAAWSIFGYKTDCKHFNVCEKIKSNYGTWTTDKIYRNYAVRLLPTADSININENTESTPDGFASNIRRMNIFEKQRFAEKVNLEVNTKYNIIFETIDDVNYREKQKIMTYKLFHYILRVQEKENFIIVVSDIAELHHTKKYFTTLCAVNDINFISRSKKKQHAFDFGIRTGIKYAGKEPLSICMFSECLNKNFVDVHIIFKGMGDGKMYDFMDAVSFVGKNSCTIFECEAYCEFFKYVLYGES